MTEKEFLQTLRRGLGSAIIELKNNVKKTEYRDVILRCCLRDISYDQQSEGTKGYYLYDAILASGEPEYFESIIIDKFHSRCNYGLLCQIASILYRYAYDGSNLAKDALIAKYNFFVAKKGRLIQRPPQYEGWQWDEVAYRLLCIDGFTAFKQFAIVVGNIRLNNPCDRNAFDPWFICRAENMFSKKRIDNFYNSMYEKSNAIKALVDSIKSDELSTEQERTEQDHVTVLALVQAATDAATDKNPRHKMYLNRKKIGLRSSFSFVTQASETEILELANSVLREENETVKALLLNCFFCRKPFPLEISPLMEYAQSENELLAEAAIECLKEFKDKRVHDLAVHLLKTKGLKSFALALLRKNYKKTDDVIIAGVIKKSASIPHHVQQDIQDIYNRFRSVYALPILLHVYQKGECSYCRKNIVSAMNHCGVLSDKILEECLFDSYDDTRKYAKRLIAKKRRNNETMKDIF